MNFENENIEFKLKATDDIYKEVIAFANTDGGVVYVGMDDSGNIVGIDDIDETYTRITNGIRDAVMPDVTIFIKYTLEDNKIIKINVNEGSSKPYYLKSKGIKPSGVYIRQGASSVPASFEQIRIMIKESDGDVYESMRAVSQELTFDSVQKTFSSSGIEFSKEKYRTLGITNSSDNLYTNLAVLISDQCSHTIKIAVFSDESNTKFKDIKECSGSVFKQLEEAFSYLKLCNNNAAEIDGLKRIDHKDYPDEALREALLNAVVHRDYSFSGSIIININDKEIEFISIGGLLPGLSKEDIKSGISQPRNRNLAEIFHRLHFIESYGTGIRRIYNLYSGYKEQPRIEVTPNTFKIILPNMNNSHSANNIELSPQKHKIIDYITQNGSISENEIQDIARVKRTRAYNIAKELCDAGIIKAVGRGKSKKYYLS